MECPELDKSCETCIHYFKGMHEAPCQTCTSVDGEEYWEPGLVRVELAHELAVAVLQLNNVLEENEGWRSEEADALLSRARSAGLLDEVK